MRPKPSELTPDDDTSGPFAPPPGFRNAAEWLRALGDVPLHRIVMRPAPGTATERDLTLRIDRGDDFGDHRAELIERTIVDKPCSFPKGLIVTALSNALGNFADRRRLGYVFGSKGPIRMASGNVRSADVFFVARDTLPDGLPHDSIASLTPTLAADVLSEENTENEVALKLREYFASGCKLAWIIDPPTQTCVVYRAPGEPTRRLTADDGLDGEDVLPGFKLRLGDLFADL